MSPLQPYCIVEEERTCVANTRHAAGRGSGSRRVEVGVLVKIRREKYNSSSKAVDLGNGYDDDREVCLVQSRSSSVMAQTEWAGIKQWQRKDRTKGEVGLSLTWKNFVSF